MSLLIQLLVCACLTSADTRAGDDTTINAQATTIYMPIVSRESARPQVLHTLDMPHPPNDIVYSRETGFVYVAVGNLVAVLSDGELLTFIDLPEGSSGINHIVTDGAGLIFVIHDLVDSNKSAVTVLQGLSVYKSYQLPAHYSVRLLKPNLITRELYVVGYYQQSNDPDKFNSWMIIDESGIKRETSLPRLVVSSLIIDAENRHLLIGGSESSIDETGNVVREGQLLSVDVLSGVITSGSFGRHVDDLELLDDGTLLILITPNDSNLNARSPDILVYRDGQVVANIIAGKDILNFRSSRFIYQPSNNTLYVIGAHSTVPVYKYISGALTEQGTTVIGAGTPARKFAIDDGDSDKVYSADFADNSISILDGVAETISVGVGWYPYGIGIDPSADMLYVSNTNDSTISVIDVSILSP